VLTEHYLKGRARIDIARDMGISLSRVYQLMWKAERLLRRRLGLEQEERPVAEELAERRKFGTPWLSKKQVCFRLVIRDNVLSEWIRQGKFPPSGTTIGIRQFWHRDIVDSFVVQE
jgi:hypothetical protein